MIYAGQLLGIMHEIKQEILCNKSITFSFKIWYNNSRNLLNILEVAMEFKKNDCVVYKSAGVCRILSVEPQIMDGENEIMYYKLKPFSDENSTYYVPVASGAEKLRRLLTKEEVLELIDTMPKSEEEIDVWSDNRRERREMYSQILKGDDQKALIQLISALYFRKQSSEANGKRFSAMDETAMKNAETLMLQEFGTVLDMTPDEVRKFIDKRVNA